MTYLHTTCKNMALSKMHWTVSCENKQQYDLSLNMQSCLTIPVKDETSDILNKRGVAARENPPGLVVKSLSVLARGRGETQV